MMAQGRLRNDQVYQLLGMLSANERQSGKLDALCLAVSLRHGDVGRGRSLALLANYDTAVIRAEAKRTT